MTSVPTGADLLQCVLNLLSNAVKFTEKGTASPCIRQSGLTNQASQHLL
jgi:signal transduction histidine kinase